MLENQDFNELVSILENEMKTTLIFLEILHEEREILTQGQINDLDKVVADKAKIIDELEAINEQRSQYLLSHGYHKNKAGMRQWLDEQPFGIKLHELWDQLIILAKQAKQENQTNGRAISLQLQYNQRSYLALQSAAGNISLYGPKGQVLI
ncbi:MAG: flagellar protein FlgN [Nitrosomonas sp.]|nr:flagellar protein FlgN [Nitrosomonas sp.]